MFVTLSNLYLPLRLLELKDTDGLATLLKLFLGCHLLLMRLLHFLLLLRIKLVLLPHHLFLQLPELDYLVLTLLDFLVVLTNVC